MEPEKKADILVVADNPLEDVDVLGRVASVAKGGALWVTENSALQLDRTINHPQSPLVFRDSIVVPLTAASAYNRNHTVLNDGHDQR